MWKVVVIEVRRGERKREREREREKERERRRDEAMTALPYIAFKRASSSRI